MKNTLALLFLAVTALLGHATTAAIPITNYPTATQAYTNDIIFTYQPSSASPHDRVVTPAQLKALIAPSPLASLTPTNSASTGQVLGNDGAGHIYWLTPAGGGGGGGSPPFTLAPLSTLTFDSTGTNSIIGTDAQGNPYLAETTSGNSYAFGYDASGNPSVDHLVIGGGTSTFNADGSFSLAAGGVTSDTSGNLSANNGTFNELDGIGRNLGVSNIAVSKAAQTAAVTIYNNNPYSISGKTYTATTSALLAAATLRISSISTDVLQVQVSYTDDAGNAQTQTLVGYDSSGTAHTSFSAAGTYTIPPMPFRTNGTSNVTLVTVLTTSSGSITYTVVGYVGYFRS